MGRCSAREKENQVRSSNECEYDDDDYGDSDWRECSFPFGRRIESLWSAIVAARMDEVTVFIALV